jgi:hypothetical protein
LRKQPGGKAKKGAGFNLFFGGGVETIKGLKIEIKKVNEMKNRIGMAASGFMLLTLTLLSWGCATPQGVAGAGLGAVVGGVSGALIDRGNPVRGAAIGGGLGAVLGGGLGDIAGSSQGYNPPPQQGYYPPSSQYYRGYYPPPPQYGYYAPPPPPRYYYR